MNVLPPITLSATDMNWDDYINNTYDGDDSTGDGFGDHLVFSIVICLFGTVANGMVIYYLGFRIRRSPFTTYILNLASADFIFLLIFLLYVVFVFWGGDFAIGIYNFSQFLGAFFLFGYSTSQYFLTAISVERSLSVLLPIWYQCHRPKKQSAVVCTVCWAFSGVVFVADFISCMHYHSCTAIHITQGVISFLILLPLMSLSNVTLVTLICRRSNRQHPPRLYILILTTVVAFLVLSLPMSLMIFLEEFGIDFMGYTRTALVNLIINSSLNPVIYFLVGSLKQQQRKCSIIASLRRAFVEES